MTLPQSESDAKTIITPENSLTFSASQVVSSFNNKADVDNWLAFHDKTAHELFKSDRIFLVLRHIEHVESIFEYTFTDAISATSAAIPHTVLDTLRAAAAKTPHSQAGPAANTNPTSVDSTMTVTQTDTTTDSESVTDDTKSIAIATAASVAAQSDADKSNEIHSQSQTDSEAVSFLHFADIVRRKAADTRELLDFFEDEDDWQVMREKNGVRTLYRPEESSGTHSFKVSGEIHAPMTSIVAVLYEIDLFHHWFPKLKFSRELTLLSRYHKLIHLEIDIPWPISNREVVADAYGVDMLEDNKIAIFLRSIDEHPLVQLPEANPHCVRAEIIRGGFIIEPLSPNSCELHFMLNVDAKIPVLPYWAINSVVGKLIHVLHGFIANAAQFDEDSSYAERVRKNRDMYGHVEKLVAEHFPESD
jgi:START domain